MRLNRTLIALSMGAALAAASASSFASPRGAERTIVGAWTTVVTIVNCQTLQPVGAPPIIGISTFNQGGTMSEWGGPNPALRSPSYGVWQRDRHWRDYSFTFMFYRYDPSGAMIGTQKIIGEAALGADGDTYESIVALEIRDLNNNLIAAPCATSVGTRIEL